MTEDVRSGIAEVSLVRNRSPEPTSPQSPSASGDSEYDHRLQRNALSTANNRAKSVFSGAVTTANGGTDVDMSPRKPQRKLSESKRRSKRRRTAAKETSEESSSSDSSSSDSDSSSDESDAPRLTGASGLKLHGQIHDLMLEASISRSFECYHDVVKAGGKTTTTKQSLTIVTIEWKLVARKNSHKVCKVLRKGQGIIKEDSEHQQETGTAIQGPE